MFSTFMYPGMSGWSMKLKIRGNSGKPNSTSGIHFHSRTQVQEMAEGIQKHDDIIQENLSAKCKEIILLEKPSWHYEELQPELEIHRSLDNKPIETASTLFTNYSIILSNKKQQIPILWSYSTREQKKSKDL